MKKYISKSGFALLFFLLSFTLFSSEITRSRSTKGGVEGSRSLSSLDERVQELSNTLDAEATESMDNATREKDDAEKSKDIENEKEKNDIDVKSSEDKNLPITPSKDKEISTAELKKNEDDEDGEFSSIQVSGLTLANGNKWYFEEYDENGNIIGTIFYNNKKMIYKSNIEYKDGKKITKTLTEQKKITKILYDDKGVETSREEYQNKKGQIGKAIASSNNIYDDNGKVKEAIKTENGITVKRVYTYEKDKKVGETVYENDVKTLFIEYKENKKIVHIFSEDIEINVFEEAIE